MQHESLSTISMETGSSPISAVTLLTSIVSRTHTQSDLPKPNQLLLLLIRETWHRVQVLSAVLHVLRLMAGEERRCDVMRHWRVGCSGLDATGGDVVGLLRAVAYVVLSGCSDIDDDGGREDCQSVAPSHTS